MSLRAYWWDPKRAFPRELITRAPVWLSLLRSVPKLQNFGDAISPLILMELTGRQVLWAPLGQEDVVCVGSVLNAYMEKGGRGVILGAGIREPNTVKSNFPVSRILGVRGLYSARVIGANDRAVIGDPGLLVSQIYSVRDRRISAPIFVPHFRMFGSKRGRALIRALAATGYTVVEPNMNPWEMARIVGKASRVLATSLHALVFADSYGVPCAKLDVPWLNEPSFKFADYRSAFEIGLVTMSIDSALSGADVREIAEEEQQLVAERLPSLFQRLYSAAEPLR